MVNPGGAGIAWGFMEALRGLNFFLNSSGGGWARFVSEGARAAGVACGGAGCGWALVGLLNSGAGWLALVDWVEVPGSGDLNLRVD